MDYAVQACRCRWRWLGMALAVLLSIAAPGRLAAQDDADIAARLADPIVGTWIGTGIHEGRDDQFNMRLTFVSPKGGISRYLDVPCGGTLVGGHTGEAYEFTETITYNGPDERSENYCASGGVLRLTVDGNTMKYDWSPGAAGQELSASGELKRQGGSK